MSNVAQELRSARRDALARHGQQSDHRAQLSLRRRSGLHGRAGGSLVLAIALALLAPSLAAQPSKPSADQVEEARRLFAEGSDLFLKKRFQEALDAVQRSYLLVPSPNSALIAARCLRDLDRPEEAAERFADAAAQAEARVAAGEQQYAPTAEAARKEGAAVRASLANLRVRVANAPNGSVVETGSTRTPVGPEGLVEMLHRPGRVVVVVRAPSGVAVRRAATLVAGTWTTVEVDLTEKESPSTPTAAPAASASSPATPATNDTPPNPPADDPKPGSREWMLPAGLVVGGAGLAGLGVFIGFGLKSRATYADLEERCAPLCSDADRSEAEDGERDAVIANVGLAVGAVGLIGGVTLVALGWPRNEQRSAVGRPSQRTGIALGLRPGGVTVRGSFR